MASNTRKTRSPDSPDAVAAGESEAKRQRFIVAVDGPMEDEDVAKKKLEEAGFRQDNFTEEKDVGQLKLSPMSYFCLEGDLKMCRYLRYKGAATTATKDGNEYWFPMMAAARGGKTEMCEWLFQHGAEADVCRANNLLMTPLRQALDFGEDHKEAMVVCKWLILKGALDVNDSDDASKGMYSDDLVRRSFASALRRRTGTTGNALVRTQLLLHWGQEALIAGTVYRTFLMGTASSNTQQSPVRSVRGKADILEAIADFVGAAHGKEARMIKLLSKSVVLRRLGKKAGSKRKKIG